MEFIEYTSPAIRMTTSVLEKNVVYTVQVIKDSVWHNEWSKTVQFGRTRTHRPGGVAFRRAAMEQEDYASGLRLQELNKDGGA